MATNEYNPNTGKKLKKGESVVDKSTGKTVTQGTKYSSGSSSSSSSSSSKSTGSSSSSSSSSSNTSSSNVVNFDPNTGRKLNPGETVVDKSTGKTVTQGTQFGSSGGSSSATTPQTITPINTSTNLKVGMQNNDIKSLQQYLKGIGIYSGAVDGIFGPATDSAVRQFQASNGLSVDGIVGSATSSKINSLQTNTNTPTPVTPIVKEEYVVQEGDEFNPYTGEPITAPVGSTISKDGVITPPSIIYPVFNTGDAAQDELLKQFYLLIKKQQDAGLEVNPNLVFDTNTLNKFLDTAKEQVSPFYQQQIDAIKEDVLRTAPQILQEYESTIASSDANFQSNLGTSRENAAGAGLAFSGQRAKGELGAQAAQDRSLTSLSSEYGNKFYNLGRGAEEKIGADNVTFNLPDLKTYSTSIAGNGGVNATGTVSPYQKGGFKLGSIPMAQEAAVEQRAQALKKTAAESVLAGRDYKSLFK